MHIVAAALTAALAAQPATVFTFHSDEFWLNLHKFLYVLGRAENKAADATLEPVAGAAADSEQRLVTLSAVDRSTWTEAIAAYGRGLSRQDPTRDRSLALLEGRLAAAGEASSLEGVDIDDTLRQVLERTAPVYRNAWWASHRATNRVWVNGTETLVAAHGASMLRLATDAYRFPWPPAGYPVHIVAYASWAGAYSTDGSLLVVSSNARAGTMGWAGLEAVFHESIHQWDDGLDAMLNAKAAALGKRVPRNLSHAIVFFTAGEAVRRVAPPGYVPLADASGAWSRGMTGFKKALEATWLPYLNGHGTRDEALAALIQRTATAPASPSFVFQTDDFWINLHHFLYALGVIEARLPDADSPALAPVRQDFQNGAQKLTTEQRQAWAQIVSRYATKWSLTLPSVEPAAATVRNLARAVDDTTLENVAIDPSLRAALEGAAPIYRAAWWPGHRDRNRAWRTQIEPLVAQYGPVVRDFLTRVYAAQWPEQGRVVRVSGYANFGGAYSLVNGGLIVVSSVDPTSQGLSGLEALFHEALHQWDPQTFSALNVVARQLHVTVPRDLTHAMIFFTTGEAMKRVSPTYVSNIDRLDIWRVNLSGAIVPASRLRQPLIEAWKPYLDGTITRDAALEALVRQATR